MTTITFINTTTMTVDVVPVHFEVSLADPVATLGPGDFSTFESYHGLPWMIIEAATNAIVDSVFGSDEDLDHWITSSGIRAGQWSEQTSVSIRNSTNLAVDLIRLDGKGEAVHHLTLAAGTYWSADEFPPCAWRVATVDDGVELATFVSALGERTAFEVTNNLLAFENNSNLVADVFRVTPSGNEDHFATLRPKQYMRTGNVAKTRWVVRDRHSGRELASVGPDVGPMTVPITTTGIRPVANPKRVEVEFTNSNGFAIQAQRMDENGRLVTGFGLHAGGHLHYPTVTESGQPWRFVEAYSGAEVAFFVAGTEAEQSFDIGISAAGDQRASTMEFANDTMLRLDLSRVDEHGEEHFEAHLHPLSNLICETTVTTPWIVRESTSNLALAVTVAGRQNPVTRIRNDQVRTDVHGHGRDDLTLTNLSGFAVEVELIDQDGDVHHQGRLQHKEVSVRPASTNTAYRFRKVGTGEEVAAMFVGDNAGYDITVPAAKGQDPTTIEFTNRTPLTVELFWVDEEAVEQRRATLQPGDRYGANTHVGHTWLTKDQHSGEVLTVTLGKRLTQQCEITTATLRSLRADHQVEVGFVNDTPLTVEAFLIDYEGEAENKATLAPGAGYTASTFATHPWRFQAVGFDGEVDFYIPTNEPGQQHRIRTNHVRTEERPGRELLEGEVAFYAQADHQGAVWIVDASVADLRLIEGLNDRIASVRVGPNTAVRLFSDIDYGGTRVELYMDEPDLSTGPLGAGTASSMRIWELINPRTVGISSRSSMVEDYRVDDDQHGGPDPRYPDAKPGGVTSSPAYRTIVTLPPHVTELEVWASAETEIEVAGVSHVIDAVKPARLKPDRLSRVMITIAATKLQAPALRLRTNTMRAWERFVVYPGAGLHRVVTELPEGALYQDRDRLGLHGQVTEEQCQHVQTAMQNIAKTVQYGYQENTHGVMHDQTITGGNMEHNHWAIDFGPSGPAYTPLTRDEVLVRTAGAERVDDQLGQNLFDEIDDFFSSVASLVVHTVEVVEDVVGDVVDTLENVGRHIASTVEDVGEDLVHGDVAAAFSDLGQGTLSIGEDLATGVFEVGGDLAAGGVKILGDIASGVSSLVVITLDLVDRSVQFVLDHTGPVGELLGKLIETVGGAIDKAIKWLMREIGWDDILHTHDVFVDSINNGLDRLHGWVQEIRADVDQSFSAIEGEVSTAIDAALRDMGTYDKIVHQSRGGSHSDAMEDAEWLMSKFSEHDSGNGVGSSLQPLFDDKLLSDFVDLAEEKIGAGGAEISAALGDAMAYAKEAFSNADITVELAISAFLEIAKAAALAGLEILNALIDAFLKLADHLITSFQATINESWEIPFISALYRYLTNDRDLSLISFTALLAAVPTTIIHKAESADGSRPFDTSGALALSTSEPAPATNPAPPAGQDAIAWGYTYGAVHILLGPISLAATGAKFSGLVDSAQQLEDEANPVASIDKFSTAITYIDLGLGFLAQLCGCPIGYPDFSNPDAFNKNVAVSAPNYWSHVIWRYQWVGWLIAVFAALGTTMAEASHVRARATQVVDDIMAGFTTVWGIVHLALMVVLSESDNAKHWRLEAGSYYWEHDEDSLFMVLTEVYKPDYSEADMDSLQAEIRASERRVADPAIEVDRPTAFEAELAGYRAYRDWWSKGGYAGKTAGNVMDTVPEIAAFASADDLVEITGGVSLILSAALGTLGHLGEGMVYIERTNQDGLF